MDQPSNMEVEVLTEDIFAIKCHALAQQDAHIKLIVDTYGFPPLFYRPFGFATLVHIILEQQVSLASARAALHRLQARLGKITPDGLLQLDAAQLRACSVSRQKANYLHHLCKAVQSGDLPLDHLPNLPDDEVRSRLMQVKGIGPWTADVVLMLGLRRPDVFPLRDLALVNSMRWLHQLPQWPVEEIKQYALRFAPYRTVAAYCYWHAYLCRKNLTV